jgi:hypothetical protein
MNAQVTERNAQIIAAYTAGNINKTELARYFGVSASTVRRVLAGIMMGMTAASAAHADLLQDYTKQGYQSFADSWINMTTSQQETVREGLRNEGHENLLLDLGNKLDQHASEPTPHLDGDHGSSEAQATKRALQLKKEKFVAQQSAEVATYQHNDPTGIPVDTQVSDQSDPSSEKNPAIQTVQQVTSTPAPQPVVKQEVRSTYYDKQITALNAEAEQNHSEVLAESHRRAVGDANTLSQANDYTNKKFNNLKSEVNGNKKEAAAGSASAMAQANIPQVQESQQFAVGAGVGGYDSQNALSVGASFHASHSTIVKMSVSDDSQSNVGYGAGVSVGW